MNQPVSATADRALRVPAWTVATAVFVVAVSILLACYWQTAQSLVWTWGHDGTYQYAFLIFPLSLWVAFSLRHPLRAKSPVPSVWGLVAVAGLVFVWYVGRLLDINLAQHFALVAMFPALVLACWGWRALRVLIFPLAYLVVFAVPWGDALVGPLQDITAHFAVRALELTGTPVLLNGREIITPSAVWMVADACSGVKFFIACMALGCLYGWLMYQGGLKRVGFVVLAALAPIVANGLRVYFTILIGESWGLEYATGTDHLIFGWQFFGTVLVLLFLAGWPFRDPIVVRANSPANGGDLRVGGRGTVWLAVVALLVAGPVLAGAVVAPVAPETLSMTAPTVAGWHGPQSVTDGWQPVFNGAAGQVRASYQSSADDAAVDLFHAVYTGKPRPGHSLITFGNNLYDVEHTRVLSRAGRRVRLANGADMSAVELRLAGVGDPRLVWYAYCVDRHCTGSPVMVKLLQAWVVLRGQVPRSSVWAWSATVTGGAIEQARRNLRAFAQALPPPDMVDPQSSPGDRARGTP